VESYSSTEGLTLFKDHEYSLISVYDNDSGERQDAMASMFLYMVISGRLRGLGMSRLIPLHVVHGTHI